MLMVLSPDIRTQSGTPILCSGNDLRTIDNRTIGCYNSSQLNLGDFMAQRITAVERAYAAGMVDGDGWFSIPTYRYKTYTRYALKVGITSNQRQHIEWFVERWGGKVYERHGNHLTKNHTFEWMLHANQAERFAKDILPHLVLKKHHARIGIAFQGLQRKFRQRDSRKTKWQIKLQTMMRKANHKDASPPSVGDDAAAPSVERL
jgi:hypothetical protein